MPDEGLKCEKQIEKKMPPDNLGRVNVYHEKCGLPASEVEIGGTLTKAKAILCVTHKLQADKQCFTSANGYPLGKIKKALKKEGYRQDRLPGTGVIA